MRYWGIGIILCLTLSSCSNAFFDRMFNKGCDLESRRKGKDRSPSDLKNHQ